MHKQPHLMSSLFLLFCLLSSLNVCFSGATEISGDIPAKQNPFTPRAYLIRYWDKEIRSNLPKPPFLLSKASPLNAVDSASFAKLASQNTLSTVFPSFCSSAKLFCFPDLSNSLEKHDTDSNFALYLNKNFTNYGTGRLGGADSFKNYSNGDNLPIDSFRRYSRDSAGHKDQFANYAPGANVVDQSFNTYGTHATGGSGGFKNYNGEVNVPNLRFSSYASDGNGRAHSFSSYTDETNAGSQEFASYGKNANGAPNDFSSYGKGSNVMGSGFSGYGEGANAANDTFTSYGDDGNNPNNKFNNYGEGGNAAIESFSSYRDQSNVGDDSFQSYGKNSNSAKVNFGNYGNSFNEGTDTFKGYGEGAKGHAVGFKIYGVNNTFKDYAKNGVTFAKYNNVSSAPAADTGKKPISGSLVNRWVEPGKFFRESKLKKGSVMPMPDIKDKMPRRSFLPRTIISKLPFSSSKINEMKKLFHAGDNSTMETIIKEALSDCERAPSPGETKRCVGSVEDMIDFATSILGRNVVVRTTENVKGSKKKIMIGSVKGINGGKVTKSVSCHQSLFPYLLYYCHSVPKVRVYEAEIMDPNSKDKINHGVAICHLDTSAWSRTHGAFLALGSGPGRIEVCHWIFENDMTWTTADDY
ncbi:Polygalacturonase-1 non-catalytic subunit beta like [Melia azedarach]|uniref:Polygalacturonase-1 non-catalytic subunit beta like n=1 Tax=Melia azedarach TaxID=155640 RepID=A0ACC1XIR9_MELAZ|nr:Polygalacturonase-1 non-catalytic subunit beta like [Melia azedarach]